MNISVTDIAHEVRDLYAPTDSESLPYVGLEHIQPDSLHLSGLGNSSDTQSTKKKFQSEDILFGTLRPYFRKVVRAKFDGVCSTDITVIRAREPIDTGFLFYLIASQFFIDYATATSSGTRMPRAKWSILSQRDWEIPEQEKRATIAAVLSAYDNLIENNTRRIKILEEMVQAIYREWFIEFRFPGHERVEMVESELGLIPQGWKVRRLGDLCKVVPGFAFKSKDWQDTGVGVVKIKNIQADNTVDIQDMDWVSSEILSPKLDKYRLVNGDFLIAMTGATAGKVGRLRTKTTMMLNQRVAKLDPIDVYRDYIWSKISMVETQNAFFRLADGAAQPNMSGSQIENYRTVCPPQSVCNHFSSVVAKMLIQTDNLMLRNANLRQTRDLLLPKLISGEIDVARLDIKIDGMQPRKGGTHIPFALADLLHSDEGILGGKPVIRGTRLAVDLILELLAHKWSEERIIQDYPTIRPEHIAACLAYQQEVTDASVSR